MDIPAIIISEMRFRIVLKSMTGFGRSEEVSKDYKISVELRSVNHRYFDLNIKLPRKFSKFESEIRNIVKSHVQRGKLDLSLSYESYLSSGTTLLLNEDILKQYIDYAKQIEEAYGIKSDMNMSSILRLPELVSISSMEEDEEFVWELIRKHIEQACHNFMQARLLEGEQLYNDIEQKLQTLLNLCEEIEDRMPVVLERYQDKLSAKIKLILEDSNIDESRIMTEVAIYADKICVDEEIVRLKSHILAIKKEIELGDNIGRKLDFISQELNREANTILSKSDDIEIADRAIELKTGIEKIREQIQNIE